MFTSQKVRHEKLLILNSPFNTGISALGQWEPASLSSRDSKPGTTRHP